VCNGGHRGLGVCPKKVKDDGLKFARVDSGCILGTTPSQKEWCCSGTGGSGMRGVPIPADIPEPWRCGTSRHGQWEWCRLQPVYIPTDATSLLSLDYFPARIT